MLLSQVAKRSTSLSRNTRCNSPIKKSCRTLSSFLGRGVADKLPSGLHSTTDYESCIVLAEFQWMQLFCLQLEASCLQWSFFHLQLTILAFLLTILAFLCTVRAFLFSAKARLIRALRDCKQRSSTVSKKAPTVSQKASPNFNYLIQQDSL